jgi:hypothetical protein
MKHAFAKIGLVVALSIPAACATAQTVDRPGHREFAWDGGNVLSVSSAMTVRVRKDGPARVIVNGPEELVKRVYLRQGHLGLENNWSWWGGGDWIRNGQLQVEISGVSVNEIGVSGSSSVTLDGSLQQRDLEVHISGSGSVNAAGQVEQLDVRVSGSGNARLDNVAARRGDLSVSGSGHVTVKAVEDADVGISGSGQVRIEARPRNLKQGISGSGRLVAGGEVYSRRTAELAREREREQAREQRERERERAREEREREREAERERRDR